MRFETLGDAKNPAVLFFHAMGVTGQSGERVAEFLKDDYFCIMPTSTVYCPGQRYLGKDDELRQIGEFLRERRVERIALVVASSIGADLAISFVSRTARPIGHVFFDGGQFAQIGRGTRRFMTPLLYLAIRSLFRSKGKTLRRILWCDDAAIRPYFVDAGRALTYRNLRAQMADSLEDKPFPILSTELQRRCFFEFGSAEEHLKYRPAVMRAYPHGNFPIFDGMNHMQFQIRDPKGFAEMLREIDAHGALTELPFLRDKSDFADIK